MTAVSVSVSGWTLVAISVERFYAICHPLVSPSLKQVPLELESGVMFIFVYIMHFTTRNGIRKIISLTLFLDKKKHVIFCNSCLTLYCRRQESGKRGVTPDTSFWPFGLDHWQLCRQWPFCHSWNPSEMMVNTSLSFDLFFLFTHIWTWTFIVGSSLSWRFITNRLVKGNLTHRVIMGFILVLPRNLLLKK